MANVCQWTVSIQTIFRVLLLFDLTLEGTAITYTNGLIQSGENVCTGVHHVTYSTKSYTTQKTHKGYKAPCGLWGWGRCWQYRQVTKAVSKTTYRLRDHYYLHCCDGWRRDGSSCPIAICDQGCNNNGRCVGPNLCSCPSGWTGIWCNVDIDECQSNNGGCQQICVNRIGNTAACICRKGYVQHPSSKTKCQDLDECMMKNSTLCTCASGKSDCGAFCTNTNGGFKCSCGSGYKLLGSTKCVDEDECRYNNGGCGEHRCINSPGSYSCLCTRGFRLENGRCKDINECAVNNGFCDKQRATCQNRRGGHRCRCKEGYILDANRRTCSDIDECSTFHGCEESCVNTIGGYYCTCLKGYELADDNITCVDINECTVQEIKGTTKTATLADCQQICINAEGSFRCDCSDGYTLMYDGKRCKDVDECISGRHHCEQSCHNTDGSYRCSCSAGYKLAADGRTCEGLPCEKIVAPHHGSMTCTGLVTNSKCSFSCNPGYSLTGSQKRICQASSRWGGNKTSCDAKHCKRLIPSVDGQSLRLPCFTSFGSNCYFGCARGFSMKGKGVASCSILSESDSVSWKTNKFSCEKLLTCQPNPCDHGGKCKVHDHESFSCDCKGTGYTGSKCQTGLMSAPVFPKLSIKSKSRALSLSARPLNKLNVFLHSESGVVFSPSSFLEMTVHETKKDFYVEVDKAGIHPISYTLGGPNEHDFQIPEQSVVFVEPTVLLNESIYSKFSLPKRELPVGCNEYRYKVFPCKLHFLSTDKWTNTSLSTKGIVHIKTPSNQSIPLSMIGFTLDERLVSRKSMIEKAVALMPSDKEFDVYYNNGDTCIEKEASSDNLLELMRDDALVTSFLQTVSQMAPSWFNVLVSESNDLFDIQNIVVSLAQIPPNGGEHCSGFPLRPSSSILYFLPAVKYEIRVGQDEASLYDEGNTCFAADVCKQSTFIGFSKESANKLKDKLAVMRDMKDKGCNILVDSVGLLKSAETFTKTNISLWNGTHYEQATPFNYNMWLKGDVSWNMVIPAMLDVTLDMKGESFIHSESMDDLFHDRLSRPLEMLLKGEAKYIVGGRALRQDFTLELTAPEAIGKVRIGGPDRCEERRQGVFMTFNEFKSDPFLKTPFHPYVRLGENDRIDVITLVSYNGGRQNMVANMNEIRRIIRNTRYLVRDLKDIFTEAISILPGEKDILGKWIQTTEAFNDKIREFRRALSITRPVDIYKIRKLTTETNEEISILRKAVEVLKNRVSLQAPGSLFLEMIEDVELGFPYSIPLRLRGESTQQRIHDMRIYFLCSICMRRLCLNDVKAEVIYHQGSSCGSTQLPVRTFYVSGTTSQSLSLGEILTVLDGGSVNMVFKRDSEHVSIVFQAQARLFGLSQSINATMDKTQLSFILKGDIFKRFPAQMSIVSRIHEVEDWKFLVYSVEGKMAKSSLLPSYLKQEIDRYILVTAGNAQLRIRRAENATRNFKIRTKEAEKLVKLKQNEIDVVSKKLKDKMRTLTQKRAKFEQAKIQFNSSLMHYLNLENTIVCEMKNCKYLETNACIPKVCRKEIRTTYHVPVCREKYENFNRVTFRQKSEVAYYYYKEPDKFHVDKGGWWPSDWKLSRRKGKTVKKSYTKLKTVREETTEIIKSFDCSSFKTASALTGHESPYECCNKDIKEKIQILDPKCVSHNAECKWNMTKFAEQLKREQNNGSALFEHYHIMTEMGWHVNLAQMEVNLAKTQLKLASKQMELARAFLLEQQYVEDAINISSIKIQEQLGLQLAARMKSLGGRALVSVERLSFSTSMTSTTKTLLPLKASVETTDGERRSIEFPMDFKRVNYSLASASKLVVKTLFGTANSRKRRSTGIGLSNDEAHMDIGERMCFFSYQANSFFGDIIHSLEFLLDVTGELFQGISLSVSMFDSHYNHSGENPSTLSHQPLEPLERMMWSLKSHYANSTGDVTWNSILDQWRSSLNVLTTYKNLTECSGSQDCVDYFFRTLDEFYLFEYGHQALDIKEQLKELHLLFADVLHQNLSYASAQEVASRAKILLNKTKDNSVLCGTGPIITDSSPAEVVVLAGDTVNLTCRVKSTSEVKIVWTKNERILDDMTDEELVLRHVNTETEGAYKCKASDNRGRAVSNVTVVKVHKAPTIIEHPGSMQVLTGTEAVSFACNSAGVPQPSTEWFFTPTNEKDEMVVRLNFSKPVLTKKSLTSEDSGFYYCNVSNIHGTLQSRKARLDVVGFSPGTPRIVVSLRFAECPPEDLLKSSPNCTEELHNPAQRLDYEGVNQTFRAMVKKLGWSWKQIKTILLSLRPGVSLSFLIQGDTPDLTSNVSPSYVDALDSYSLSHYKLGNTLNSFRSVVDTGKFKFPWKNVFIAPKKGSFAAELYTQKCPVGTEADKHGFLCVNCPRGHYSAENGTCLQCPDGTYQPEERSTTCLKCPFIRSLTQPGAIKESECIDISIPCKPPNTTKHVKSLNESTNQYRTGDKIVLECKPGYRGIGNGTVECYEGNWTTQGFFCEKTCYPPWTQLRKRCYHVVDVPSGKWDDAQTKCQSLNSQMMMISTVEENEFIAQFIKAHMKNRNIARVTIWLGLRKKNTLAQFQWLDGTPLDGYTNWAPGEPNNDLGVELCTEILVSGRWNDVRCITDYKSIIVCEKPLEVGD